VGPNVQDKYLRLFLHDESSVAAPEEGSAIVNTGSITGLEGSKELLDYHRLKARFTRSRNRWRRTWLNAAFASTALRLGQCGRVESVDKEPKDVAEFGGDTR
jgi:hypothetical protein